MDEPNSQEDEPPDSANVEESADDPLSAESRTDRSNGDSKSIVADKAPSHWLWVLCLLGVDYFSTLSYQPSITYHVAGPLGPIAIAAIALEMSQHVEKPPGLHFGWSELDLLAASSSYLAFGEGNVPWKVRELIMETEPNPQRRPRVVIG